MVRRLSAHDVRSQSPTRERGFAHLDIGVFQRWVKQPKQIYQKIGYGYGLSIGIGLAGMVVGLVVADHYQGQGVEQLFDAQIQTQIFRDFERATKDVQLAGMAALQISRAGDRPSAIAPPSLNQSLEQSLEERLVQSEAAIQQAYDHINAFLAGDLSWVARDTEYYATVQELLNGEPDWLADDVETLTQFFQEYDRIMGAYLDAVHRLLDAQPMDAVPLSEQEAQEEIQEAIATIMTLNDELQTLDTTLNRLLETAQTQELAAASEMEVAQGLEKLIIFASILASAAIAGLFAWKATRAIAQPIETITQVARRSAMELDYRLRVPPMADDEIGILGRSINQLIESVAHQTAALEEAAHTAETNAQELQIALKKLQKAQMQLVQTEKMSSLGQLVAGIAHEINNPVSFIYGNLTYAKQYLQDVLRLLALYQEEYPSPSLKLQDAIEDVDLDFLRQDLPQLFQSIELGAERIKSLVLSMRIFSRLNEAEVKPVDIHQGIESSLIILGHRLKAQPDRIGIQMDKDYGTLPPIECYAGQLNQVFMNILANAIDALDTVAVNPPASAPMQANQSSIASELRWVPTIRIQTQCLSNHWIEIKISNNGSPIPPDIQAKLFDPFFTTKPIGKGTGLGLSISYDIIVEKHHGQLICDSSPHQDVSFIIRLPVDVGHRSQKLEHATP